MKMSTNNIENNKDKEQVMVPIDYSIKHPLEHKWTLWYFGKNNTKSWLNNLKEIGSFDTVEDFWSLYNHIKSASELRNGCDYAVFKAGITPIWEDDLDRYWLDLILCLIGESFENSQEVCGAVVNVRRRDDKMGIWTANAMHSEAVYEIGQKLKEKLHIQESYTIAYSAHKDIMDNNFRQLYTL